MTERRTEPSEETELTERDPDGPDDAKHLPDGLLSALREDPTSAPLQLALAAVDHWGEQARDYAARVREQRPNATNAELAAMVKKRHVRLARLEGAAAGVPVSTAPATGPAAWGAAAATLVPDLALLAWIQCRMVVHIAAVYGHDTTDKETAAELLVLQGIYNSTEAARVALAQFAKRVATRLVNKYVKGGTLVLLKELFNVVGVNFTRASMSRAVPFVAIPISAGVNEASTRSLAKQAVRFYELEPRSKNKRKKATG